METDKLVRVWIQEDQMKFQVEYLGVVHSATMSENSDGLLEPENVQGDVSIIMGAGYAWSGEEHYFQMTDKEFSERSGGYWSPPE